MKEIGSVTLNPRNLTHNTLTRKCHLYEIFITGCTGSCHFDNFQCSQWWKFHQNDNSSISVCTLHCSSYTLHCASYTHHCASYTLHCAVIVADWVVASHVPTMHMYRDQAVWRSVTHSRGPPCALCLIWWSHWRTAELWQYIGQLLGILIVYASSQQTRCVWKLSGIIINIWKCHVSPYYKNPEVITTIYYNVCFMPLTQDQCKSN